MTERFNIIFKEYPLEIQLSASRKKKYWKPTDALPKNIQKSIDEKKVFWDQGVLWATDIETRKPFKIVKNSQVAGTPRTAKISGQMFWQGGKKVEWYRQALKEQLTAYYVPRITRLEWEKLYTPYGYFIQFEFIFFTPLILVKMDKQYESQDANNHAYPYIKVFHDVMQELKVIETDGPSLVRGDYYRYVDIEDPVERRLEVKIHFCKNNQSINQ